MARRSTRTLGSLLLFAALVAGGGVRADEPAPAPSRAEAEALLAAGRWAEARDAFQGLVEKGIESGTDAAGMVPLFRGLGRALLQVGETYDAVAHLEQAAKSGSADDRLLYAEALVAHARALLAGEGPGKGRAAAFLEDALTAAAKAEGDPSQRDRRLAVVGDAHDLAGRTEAAAEAWRQVALAEPPTAVQRWCREHLAHALYRLGRHRDSAEAYESVGQRRGAAAAWAAAKDLDRSLAHYAALLAEHPDDAGLLEEALATARFTGGQQRLDAVLAGLTAPGMAVPVLRARARLAEQRGDFATALRHLRAAQAAEPEPTPGLAVDLARVLVNGPGGGQAAREEAARLLQQAWERARGHALLRDLMLAIAQQDFADAWRAWPDRRPLARCVALQRTVLDGVADDPVALQNLGNSLRQAGEHEEAVTTFDRAVVLAPSDAGLRNDQGLALSAAGRSEASVTAFRRAVEDDPAFLAARQNLARALWRAGDDAGARAELAAAAAAARARGAPWRLYRFLGDRAWRTAHRPERR